MDTLAVTRHLECKLAALSSRRILTLPQAGWLDQTLSPQFLKPWIKALTGLAPGEVPQPGLQMAAFLTALHMEERGGCSLPEGHQSQQGHQPHDLTEL